ncbi:hypothetical protein JG688_00014430 [Phytophthora aleatoria]|uniref:RxLR effector protein n=1 Tax=Phytophthora aleatoria TaxID=2496075 RepID=A0A8J5M3A6_9STRA|nr:hypothetical protein JG688_00014430 [Phytophthora aleatoria]
MNFGKLFPLVAMALSVYSAELPMLLPPPRAYQSTMGGPITVAIRTPHPRQQQSPMKTKLRRQLPQAGQSIMDARTTADILTPLQLHTILKEAIQARTER